MPRRAAPLALLALASLALLAAAPGQAQQGEPPFRPTPGRFAPGPGDELAVLDTYTGRVHLAAAGEALGGDAWVVDVERAVRWKRPLARDVSGGHVLPTSLPVSGQGAGAPVFAWHPQPGGAGVLDTRIGVHYLIVGRDRECRIVRTDLRLLTRSVREVPAPAGE